jgi:hypothetical protein
MIQLNVLFLMVLESEKLYNEGGKAGSGSLLGDQDLAGMGRWRHMGRLKEGSPEHCPYQMSSGEQGLHGSRFKHPLKLGSKAEQSGELLETEVL